MGKSPSKVITVYGASSRRIDCRFIDAARHLGELIGAFRIYACMWWGTYWCNGGRLLMVFFLREERQSAFFLLLWLNENGSILG